MDDLIEILAPQIETMHQAREAEEAFDDRPVASETLPETHRERVLSALGGTAVDIDLLVRETRLPAATVRLALIELELAGRLDPQADGRIALA